jgi:hypothetical protein
MSGLTIIKNPTTQKEISYRPTPFDRLNINIGERPIVGIPYLRTRNFKPVDSRISNTSRLGQTTTLNDKRMTGQNGEGFFGDVLKGVKKIGKKIKKKKILSKTAGLVGDIAGKAVAPVALALGHPEIAATAATVGAVATPVSKGLKMLGLGVEEEMEKKSNRLQKQFLDIDGVSSGPIGIDKQVFISTHPANYKKIKIQDLQ